MLFQTMTRFLWLRHFPEADMSNSLLAGTRKGLFRLTKTANSWDISDAWFLGDPVSIVLPEPESKRIHAALDLGHFGVKIQE